MKLHAATMTDGYKVGHGAMYADGTESVYANLTPRTDKIYKRNATRFYDGKLVFIGAFGAMQEINETWQDSFFGKSKEVAVGRFARRMEGYFGSRPKAVEQLAALHDLGYLPLKVKTLAEGVKVGMGIPVLTVTNTIADFFWLVNYHETVISDLVWKPSTNATIAAEYKAICTHYAKLTGCFDEFGVGIQCHDFSMRGMSGPEDAARSGFGHITSFLGTDTLPAIDYAEDYYNAEGFIACSVPATEHAVATSNILYLEEHMIDGGYVLDARLHAEMEFMHDLITRKFPSGVVSYVADSFDFWAVLTKILPALKDVIMARDTNGVTPGKLVVRPDSGDPVEVICGAPIHKLTWEVTSQEDWEDEASDIARKYVQDMNDGEDLEFFVETLDGEILRVSGHAYVEYDNTMHFHYEGVELANRTPEEKGAIEVLWEIFGGTETSTGHKMLDSHIGLIYGDSITTKRAAEILDRLEKKGFASLNVVFGVGSYTYQCNTRDTFGFAVKATHTVVDGESVSIFKDPITDSKKKSAKGLLQVGARKLIYGEDGEVVSYDEIVLTDDVTPEVEDTGLLTTLFEDGKFVRQETLMDIRKRIAAAS